MKKPLKLIKNRSDIGAGTRGSDMGIDAMEIAAINKDNDFFNKHDFENLETHNESIYNMVKNSFAKRISFVVEQCSRLSMAVNRTISDEQFPLVMSGDHSSALGTISGVKAAYPDQELAVIWIDAHADLHSPYTSPSGNIHGMPLGAAIADDNIDYQVNTLSEGTLKEWTALKNIGKDGAKIKPENIVFFGVRDTEEPEDKQIEKYKIPNYKVDECRFRGISTCVKEALERVSHCPIIYISFDVDSMDCDLISYGTGTPVPKGFDQHEVIEIIKQIMDSDKVVCFEVVEVNPLLDNKANKMAETAFEVVDAIFGEDGSAASV